MHILGKDSPFNPFDMERVDSVITAADKVIRDASARTADNAMQVLQNSVEVLKSSLSNSRRKRSGSANSIDTSSTSASSMSTSSDMTMNGMEDFTFTYEEEADPEIFFVPYCWDVIVSTITASSLEWNKREIQVFPINEIVSSGNEAGMNDDVAPTIVGNYADDIGDVV